MADLKLKRVIVRNWMRFRTLDLDMPEKGLILVQGLNSASGGSLMSVGSGKTGLGEAVSRTLLGTQGRFAHYRQFSSDKNGNTYVRLEAELLGKPLVVESGYACEELNPKNEALRYRYDGKTVERGTLAQTRSELSKLLGVSPLLAAWTVFIDGDEIKFNRLSQEDSVGLVMSSLRQPPWSAYHEASKAFLGRFRLEMAASEAHYANAAESWRNAQSLLKEAQQRLEEEQRLYDTALRNSQARVALKQKAINLAKQNIQAAQVRLKTLKKELKELETTRAESSHRLEIEIHDLEEEIRRTKENNQPLKAALRTTQDTLTEARIAYKNYLSSAEECPTCKRPMGKVDPRRAERLKREMTLAQDQNNRTEIQCKKAENSLNQLTEQLQALYANYQETTDFDSLERITQESEEAQNELDYLNKQAHALELELAQLQQGPPEANLKAAQVRVRDRQRVCVSLEDAVKTTAKACADDQAALQVLEYWNLAFSPFGIPNMVLADVIAPLNKEAQRISAAMTGGTISVSYSTVRELASGLRKAQLNIEVDNRLGSKDLCGNSKGESSLTNFIIAETLSEVGQVSRRIGFRWYDEIVPHQDQKVCHSIYAYMKDIADRLGILIFLVDHNPTAANYADRILVIEKKSVPEATGNSVVSIAYWR